MVYMTLRNLRYSDCDRILGGMVRSKHIDDLPHRGPCIRVGSEEFSRKDAERDASDEGVCVDKCDSWPCIS